MLATSEDKHSMTLEEARSKAKEQGEAKNGTKPETRGMTLEEARQQRLEQEQGHERIDLETSRSERNPKERSPKEAEAKPKSEEQLQLERKITQGLPSYLEVVKGKPEDGEEEAEPTPIARQAEREWPGIARGQALPEGGIAGFFDEGVFIRIGELDLAFNLVTLWRDIGVMR